MITKEITINDKTFLVKKLALKEYADVLAAIQELPKHLDQFNNKSKEEIVGILPVLISQCYPDVVRIISIATNMTEEDINEMGLDDFIAVVEVSLELNNYDAVYKRIKKMLPHQEQAVTVTE